MVTLWFCNLYKVDSSDYSDGRWQDLGLRFSETQITPKTWRQDGIQYGIFDSYAKTFASEEEANGWVENICRLYR